jgi:argininosuccinate lyase
MEQKQATWGGRFRRPMSPLMARFSESVSFDRMLACFDVRGSKAHAAMLAHVGLISVADRDAILAGLDDVLRDIEAGAFEWQVRFEDVHMNIEQELTKRVPAAARLHTARSRNDQVATDMRPLLQGACEELVARLDALLAALVDFADGKRRRPIPRYTHVQRAQR